MNAEKTAVLVVTGIVAVLLAVTLARSRPEGEPLESTDDHRKGTPLKEKRLEDPFVRIRPGGSPGGGDPPSDPHSRQLKQAPGRSRSYRIKPDDTFESIALEAYGRRSLVHLLIKANPRIDPRRLKIGTGITIPHRPQKMRPGPGQRPARGRRSEPADRPAEGWHVVRSGERLETIARVHYGRRSAWRRIYDANRDQLRDPDRIREGMRLRLP